MFNKYFHDILGKIININVLNKRVQALQRLPLTHIKPVLKKSSLSTTDLVLLISDVKDVTSLTLANGGSRFTSKNTIMLNSQMNNLSGNGDMLSLNVTSATTNPKYLNSLQLGYVLPVGEVGGRLNASYTKLSYRLDPNAVGLTTSAYIRYRGGADNVSVGYEQPLQITKGDIWWGLGIERKNVSAQTVYNQTFGKFNAGSLYVDSRDKTFVVSAKIRGSKLDEWIPKHRALSSFSLELRHAVEGVMGSMTSEDISRKITNVANLVEPITGPIGNVVGMDPRFWKLYIDLSRDQFLGWDTRFKILGHMEITKSKKLPSSYNFIGADNGASGYHVDMSFIHSLNPKAVVSLGYTVDSAISYYRNTNPGCNGSATAVGRNQCTTSSPYAEVAYRNKYFIIDAKYVNHIALYEQSLEKFKVNISYLW